MTITRRLVFLDNLRVALTILLIAHHVGQAYGPTGGWWPVQETARASVLGPFFTVNRSFFMSLFFMISGYFTAMSCAGKGATAFLKSRLLRLGIPFLVFTLSMIPLQVFVFAPPADQAGSAWEINVGYLWYIEHLLIFSACYALWWTVRGGRAEFDQQQANPPGYLAVLLFAFALAVASAIVRIWYPIDRWVNLLGFIRVAFADVPRDLSFFVVGAVAYRRQWLLRFSTTAGMVWLSVGVTAAALWYAYALGLRAALPVNEVAMGVIYPIWESLLCCGMCIGLLVLFREKLDFQGQLGQAMAWSQYTAYLYHAPIVILLQYVVIGAVFDPLAKFVLVTLVSVPLTFLFSNWVRQLPYMREIL